jgi:hypothetical protein
MRSKVSYQHAHSEQLVRALVQVCHHRESIKFFELQNAAYPAHTRIKLILNNHSTHISKETKAWLADQSGTVSASSPMTAAAISSLDEVPQFGDLSVPLDHLIEHPADRAGPRRQASPSSQWQWGVGRALLEAIGSPHELPDAAE